MLPSELNLWVQSLIPNKYISPPDMLSRRVRGILIEFSSQIASLSSASQAAQDQAAAITALQNDLKARQALREGIAGRRRGA